MPFSPPQTRSIRPSRPFSATSFSAFFLFPTVVRAESIIDPADIVAGIARDLRLQTDLPREAEPPGWLDIDLPAALLWILLALAIALVLYVLAIYFRDEILPLLGIRPRRADWSQERLPEGAAFAAGASRAMTSADELARQGQFVEAMHRLLLEALSEIRSRLQIPLADSLTSREVLRHSQLEGEGYEALRNIIGRVELTYFGTRPADQAAYADCRESFAVLANALIGGAG